MVRKKYFPCFDPLPPLGRPLRDGQGSRVGRLLHRPVAEAVGNASFQVQSQHREGRQIRESRFQRELVGHDRRNREEGELFLEGVLFKLGQSHTHTHHMGVKGT